MPPDPVSTGHRSIDSVHADPVETWRDGPAAGLTVREIARRFRVGEDKVHAWIRRGELRAINTAATLCGKPLGLSLGDRACLALAMSREASVPTGDCDWLKAKFGIEVIVFR